MCYIFLSQDFFFRLEIHPTTAEDFKEELLKFVPPFSNLPITKSPF